MIHIHSSTLALVLSMLAANMLLVPPALADLSDEGGYHLRFIKGRSCLANAYESFAPLEAKPCRELGHDPEERFDPFGPFYVLTLIRDHDEHKWLESRLTGHCISATPSAYRRRPFADMCRPGSKEQKWELLHEANDSYRVRHAQSGLCLGYKSPSQHVTLLPCDDDHTAIHISLQDPYPNTELPPFPPPHDS